MSQLPCILCQKKPRRKGGKYCNPCHNSSMRALRRNKKAQLQLDLKWMVEFCDAYIRKLVRDGEIMQAGEARIGLEKIAKRHNVPRGTS